MDLRKTISLFLTAKRGRGRAVTTLAWYESILSSFAAWLDTQPDAELSPEIIDLYMAALHERATLRPQTRQDPGRTQLKAGTIAGHDRALRAFFAWCVKREYLARSPMANLEKPEKNRREPKGVQVETYQQLLNSIPGGTWVELRDRLIVETLYLAGVRVKELCGLRIADFDLTQRLIIVRNGKGGDDLPVPLLDPVRQALALYMLARPATDCPFVFLSHDGRGEPRDTGITPSGVRQMLWRRWRSAGLPYQSPHKFRHGLARYLLNETGADMALIQKILRHKRITTTAEIYAAWDMVAAQRQFEDKMRDVKKQSRNK